MNMMVQVQTTSDCIWTGTYIPGKLRLRLHGFVNCVQLQRTGNTCLSFTGFCLSKRPEMFHRCVAYGVSKADRSVCPNWWLSFEFSQNDITINLFKHHVCTDFWKYIHIYQSIVFVTFGWILATWYHCIGLRDVQPRQDGLQGCAPRYFLSFQHISIPYGLDRTSVEDCNRKVTSIIASCREL